jgi:hypothetical protein
MTDRMGTTNVGCSYDLGTNHPALTFTVKIAIPLSGTAWTTISAVVPMTNRMGARWFAKVCCTYYLITYQPRGTLVVCITISLTFCAWPTISTVIPMAYWIRANIRSLAYVDLTWDLDTGQSVLTFTVIVTVTFALGTGSKVTTVI